MHEKCEPGERRLQLAEQFETPREAEIFLQKLRNDPNVQGVEVRVTMNAEDPQGAKNTLRKANGDTISAGQAAVIAGVLLLIGYVVVNGMRTDSSGEKPANPPLPTQPREPVFQGNDQQWVAPRHQPARPVPRLLPPENHQRHQRDSVHPEQPRIHYQQHR